MLRNEGRKRGFGEDSGDEVEDGEGAVNTRSRGLLSGANGMGQSDRDGDGSDLDM